MKFSENYKNIVIFMLFLTIFIHCYPFVLADMTIYFYVPNPLMKRRNFTVYLKNKIDDVCMKQKSLLQRTFHSCSSY